MKDWILFLAGSVFGMFTYSSAVFFREFYGQTLDDTRKTKCKLCGEYGAEGHNEDLGSVCAECEINLWQVEKHLENIK